MNKQSLILPLLAIGAFIAHPQNALGQVYDVVPTILGKNYSIAEGSTITVGGEIADWSISVTGPHPVTCDSGGEQEVFVYDIEIGDEEIRTELGVAPDMGLGFYTDRYQCEAKLGCEAILGWMQNAITGENLNLFFSNIGFGDPIGFDPSNPDHFHFYDSVEKPLVVGYVTIATVVVKEPRSCLLARFFLILPCHSGVLLPVVTVRGTRLTQHAFVDARSR